MQPPEDASGGFMLLKYSNGTDTHHMRVHLAPFTLGPWTGAEQGGASVDYSYAGTQGTGTEPTVAATFAALCAALRTQMHSSWTFTLDQLYQIVNHVPTMIPVPANPTPIAGSGATAPSSIDRYTAQILNFRTANGSRARIELISGTGFSTFGAGAVGTSNPQVAYLTGTNTAVVAHDGSKLLAPAHVTYAQLKRLRRKYGQA